MAYEPTRLRELAREVEYEVTTMFGQVEALMLPRRDWRDPVYMALVEAPLVHLRLLDDFLGRDLPERHDDVVARHFLANWTPQPFLDQRTRDTINAQLHHLAGRRRAGATWDFPCMLAAFAHRFLEFANELAEQDPDRAEWFRSSIDCCWFMLDDPASDERYPNVLHGS